MDVGMIGIGRMGGDMVRRLLAGGHRCVVYSRTPSAVAALAAEGAVAAVAVEELVRLLPAPRVVWLMVPAAAVDALIDLLTPLLSPGDLIVDGGNSRYHDDLRRSRALSAAELHYMDVGTSGGVWGRQRGYCLMAGGDATGFARIEPLLATLAPGRTENESGAGTAAAGYLHCGPAGAGHFVKMVHNGIEYGLMAAYAEGFNLLHHAGIGRHDAIIDAETAPLSHPEIYAYDFDLAAIAELWRHGSVISSWLLDLSARALVEAPKLENFSGRVSDSGEGRWTISAAIDTGTPVPVLSTALFQRFSSRGAGDFADRLLSALRYQFGGHHEKSGGDTR